MHNKYYDGNTLLQHFMLGNSTAPASPEFNSRRCPKIKTNWNFGFIFVLYATKGAPA
jgi:hypothetical protein